jgi:hypothetical protein
MGDFTVHRLRIGEWVPSAVRSIAADPFSSKVAVGRENGEIEVSSGSIGSVEVDRCYMCWHFSTRLGAFSLQPQTCTSPC